MINHSKQVQMYTDKQWDFMRTAWVINALVLVKKLNNDDA